MAVPDKRSPAPRGNAGNRAGFDSLPVSNITTRRELEGLAIRLHAMGPRPIFELLRDMLAGRNPAEIVADFARIDPAVYAALAAFVTDGGRA